MKEPLNRSRLIIDSMKKDKKTDWNIKNLKKEKLHCIFELFTFLPHKKDVL